MKSDEEMRTALRLDRAVDSQLDILIRAATERVNDLGQNSGMKENQIRNVLNVAAGTTSQEVVTNFIRYQIGRSKPSETWQHNHFGRRVIGDIESGAVERALAAAVELVPEADKAEAGAKLTRLYLGYLNRAFVAASKAGFEVLDRIATEEEGGQGDV